MRDSVPPSGATPRTLGRVRFAYAGLHRPGDSWHLGAHSHPLHEMIVVLRGAQHVVIEGRELFAAAGDVLLYPALTPHEEWTDPGVRLESVFIAFEWSGWRPGLPLRVRDDRGMIREAAGWLQEERVDSLPAASRRRSSPAEALREALMRAILAEYLLAAGPRTHAIVERVRAYAASHLSERLALEDLAKRAGLSKYHFIRRYRALTGLTPAADVRRMRLEAARALLVTTDLPLKAIAPQVGLANEYHLSRLFARQFGICARDLRRAIQV